jgi:hypothetical protein
MSKVKLYAVDDLFFHKTKKKLYKVVSVNWMGTLLQPSVSKVKKPVKKVDDWLYDIQDVSSAEVLRYYEGRLTLECEKVTKELPKAIYG